MSELRMRRRRTEDAGNLEEEREKVRRVNKVEKEEDRRY